MGRKTFQFLLLGFAILALFSGNAIADPATKQTGSHSAVLIVVHGVIDDTTVREVRHGIAEAHRLNADTVILQLNTPGGLVGSGLSISRMLKQQDDLHIIAYVEDMALSAGIMVALAADEIVMQPGSMIGDSAPIAIGSDGQMQTLGSTERAKAESPILADFRDSAFKNHYDPLLAEAMVSASRVVHWIENDKGERKLVDAPAFAKLLSAGWTEVDEPGVPKPIDGSDTLLTINDHVAIKLGLARQTIASVDALAQDRDVRIIATFSKSAGSKFIEFLGNDIMRGLLLVIFIQSLIIALHTPGHGAPEAFALISLSLLLGVPLMTGYAQWWEILAILLGLVLLALEIFVLPGFGVAGILGIVLMLFGFIMTFVGNTPEVPGSWHMSVWAGLQKGLTALVAASVVCFLLTLWLRKYLPKLPIFNRLILTAPSGLTRDAGAGSEGPTDIWPFVGTVGRAVSDLKPGGTAEFPFGDDARQASVVSSTGFVRAGTSVTVREVHGSHVVVRGGRAEESLS